MCCPRPAPSPEPSAGPTRARSGVALVYLGEHYVVDLAAGLALTRGRARARRSPRRCSGRRLRACSGSRRGRAREHDRDAPSRRAEHARARRRRGPRSTRRGSTSPRRNLAGFAVFVVLAIVALYFLLPQIAGLRGDLAAGSRTAARSGSGSRSSFTVGMFGGYVLLFHGVFARAAEGRVSAARELPDHAWPAWRPRGCSPPAAPAASCCTAWALRGAGLPRRVVADKTITFLVLTYLVYTTCAGRVRLRAALRRLPRARRRSR